MTQTDPRMAVLWAPWRMEYVQAPERAGCIFCIKPGSSDDVSSLILARGREAFVIMNLYPYNSGHLMVAPYRHVGSLGEVEAPSLEEIMLWAQVCETVLSEVVHPEGFNLGINLGRCAGAGIDGHLHLHIVPRWSGDTNFMPVLADVKSIPEHIDETYARLRPLFDREAEARGLGLSSHSREER